MPSTIENAAPQRATVRLAVDVNPDRVLPIDIGGGKVVNIPVCWSAEQCKKYLADNWNGGPMVLATMQSPDYKPKGTVQELAWFLATVAPLTGTLTVKPLVPGFVGRPGDKASTPLAAPKPYRQVRT